MKRRVYFALLSVALLLRVAALPSPGQSGPVVQDPQAVATFNQSLNAAGGVQALGTVSDFTATGTITYYWGGPASGGHRHSARSGF